MSNKALITGITGNVGSEVVNYMQKSGFPFVAGVRDVEKAMKSAGSHFTYVNFDFENPATFQTAFSNVDTLFLVRPPALADFNKHIRPVIDYAKQIDINHIVFLSLMGIERNPIPPHYRIEKHIKSLNIPYTFLRPSFFMQNLNQAHCIDIKEHNDIFIPSGKAKVSFIDTRDIGEIAAKILIGGNHKYKAYTLTGGEALDYYQVAEVFSSVLERNIVYSNPSPFKFRKVMIERGLDKKYVNVMVALYLTTRMGLAKKVTSDSALLLGRPPITIKDYIKDHVTYWQ